MRTVRQGLIELISVGVSVGGMTLVLQLGNEAEAGDKKYFKKYFGSLKLFQWGMA